MKVVVWYKWFKRIFAITGEPPVPNSSNGRPSVLIAQGASSNPRQSNGAFPFLLNAPQLHFQKSTSTVLSLPIHLFLHFYKEKEKKKIGQESFSRLTA